VTRARLAFDGTFRSLRNRNYRLFWFGQLVSLCGTWMQTVALGWLVLELHGRGSTLGLVVAAQFVPTLVAGPWGGLLADRFDKRRILVTTQTFLAVIAAVLAGLTLAGVVRLWMLYVISLATGVVAVFDNPTRQAFVTEMVGPKELANAVGLNSAEFNAARIVGPAIAGALILAVGTGMCFAINAVSFVAVIAGLVAMRRDELFTSAPVTRAKGQVRAGLRYALSVPELRMALALLAVVGTFAMNFTVVLPLLAKDTFHGNAATYGLLSTAMGLGSLIGALWTAHRARPTGPLLVGSSAALGVLMVVAAIAPSLAWEYGVIAVTGLAAIAFMSTCNSTIQLNSRADMRGRVMALYMVLFLGSTPIGGPIVGWVAQQYGARWSLVLGGVASLVGALAVSRTLLNARRAGAAPAPVPERLADAAMA
jgi:MFS family permease